VTQSPKSEIRNPRLWTALAALVSALSVVPLAPGTELPADLLADRTAVEQVYYNHRLGNKPPFEEALPADQLRRLVELDLAKEAALKKVYGVEVTPAMLAAEVQRINTTTRAPEILAELKAALGNDTNRFARTVARPIVVERLLRARFENDDVLHAPQRREAERVRERLLAAKRQGGSATNLLVLLKQDHTNEVVETIWELGVRPAETSAPDADLLEVRKRFGPDAQILATPRDALEQERKFHFADLSPALQNVLRVQLRQTSDVSAVIETPVDFRLFLALEKTEHALTTATLTLPKRSYEQWLSEPSKIP